MLDKFAKNLKAIVGSVNPEQSHNNRYINLDGTPYGSSGLMRFILSPRIPVVAAIAALQGATIGLLVQNPLHVAAETVAAFAPTICVWEIAELSGWFFAKKTGVPSIIDKKGLDGDSISTERTHRLYRNSLIWRAAAASPIPVIQGLNSTTAWGVMMLLGLGVFDMRAMLNLLSGKWTALTTPPKKREPSLKKQRPQPRSLHPAKLSLRLDNVC